MVLSSRYTACVFFLRRTHTHVYPEGNYYKILGISPSASQAEIKAAYFELSKKHHPDRNQGSEESAKIFRLIKTAYEVLGSQKTRLQYDKEQIFQTVRRPLYTQQTRSNPDYTDDAERIHYQSRARPPFRKNSHASGKTTYYDFDAWFEGHYGRENSEIHEFRKPRQFTYHPKQEVREKQMQVLSKLRHKLLLVFYLAIIFSGIGISSDKW